MEWSLTARLRQLTGLIPPLVFVMVCLLVEMKLGHLWRRMHENLRLFLTLGTGIASLAVGIVIARPDLGMPWWSIVLLSYGAVGAMCLIAWAVLVHESYAPWWKQVSVGLAACGGLLVFLVLFGMVTVY